MLSIIVAKARNNIIGKNNQLLWHLPDDMKRFKALTTGHPVIMGRKTFESIGKPLPNRENIVFTTNPDFSMEAENVKVVHGIEEIKEYIDSEENAFVIGGAMIYNLLLPYTKVLYVTEINKDFEGDTFFTKINEEEWKEISRQEGPADGENDFSYEYVVYKRIKNV